MIVFAIKEWLTGLKNDDINNYVIVEALASTIKQSR